MEYPHTEGKRDQASRYPRWVEERVRRYELGSGTYGFNRFFAQKKTRNEPEDVVTMRIIYCAQRAKDWHSRIGPYSHSRRCSPPIHQRQPRSGELRTQKLRSHLVRTQSLNVLPLKPRVGQCIAIHATLTANDFLLAYFYLSGPFTCIFFLNLSRCFLCWLWLKHGSCVGPKNKLGHPAGCRFPCWESAEYK